MTAAYPNNAGMARMALITPYSMPLAVSAARCTITAARAQLLPQPRITLQIALLNDLRHAVAVIAMRASRQGGDALPFTITPLEA